MDDRDPILVSLFEQVEPEQGDEEFVQQVMAKSTYWRYRTLAPWLLLALTVVVATWYLAIPLALAQLVAHWLTMPLVPLADGWLLWLLSPINNLGALLLLAAKGVRMLQRRILGPLPVF